jgi:4,5-DOPA dioxygenase extradiol
MRMPVLFAGHGNPMNAVGNNAWGQAFKALAPRLPRPKSILCISAHWFIEDSCVTAEARPKTIHDFGGFPDELYTMQYPALGSPELAQRVAGLLKLKPSSLRNNWGLDHGTWSVLVHLFPKADIPVVQLSVDENASPEQHMALGRCLAPLRREGVLIMSSGNVTHNLADAFGRMSQNDKTTPKWAKAFDEDAAEALEQGQESWLLNALNTTNGKKCHPSPDHWLPLLYAAGAAGPGSKVDFPITGFDLGSLSMRAALWH